ncbi:hypothetical protein AC519_2573 [Pseudomonas savastanoi]|nr:hypothetical protein AC519_2573 [Pseudomonas savastanoi]
MHSVPLFISDASITHFVSFYAWALSKVVGRALPTFKH